MVSPVFRYTAIVFNPDKQIISAEWKTEKTPLPSHLCRIKDYIEM